MLHMFGRRHKADFIVGGQWGSEGKGAAAAALAKLMCHQGRPYDFMTTNAGAQAGHTSTHNGKTRVTFHLPTAAFIQYDETGYWPYIFINAGAIIDPEVFFQELEAFNIPSSKIGVHPNAAVITPECKEAEGRADSGQTKIASTRKGVGEALARKVLRTGQISRDHPKLEVFAQNMAMNSFLDKGFSMLVEVPQGLDLSVNEEFYPYCTSRNCTIQQAMSDADIHPHFYGETMLVLRSFPIRVGNIVENGRELGQSGGFYSDQVETSWEALGQKPEITTVTKRVRRVFTYSHQQAEKALRKTRPGVIYATFLDYMDEKARTAMLGHLIMNSPQQGAMVYGQYGPTTNDYKLEYQGRY